MALTVLSLEIPAGQSLSNALDCSSGKIVRLGVPSDWTPAPLTFQVSPDGNDFRDLYHAQTITGSWQPFEAIVPTVIPNSFLSLPPDLGLSIGFIKVRSGTRTKPVNQTAVRTFTFVFESNV